MFKWGNPVDTKREKPYLHMEPSWRPYEIDNDNFDFLNEEERNRITFARLKNIYEYAKNNTKYYKNVFNEKPIQCIDDFTDVPILTRDKLMTNLPPLSNNLLSNEKIHSKYVFSSGGSTGNPKVVYRTVQENYINAARIGKGLKLIGIGPQNTVANLLFAGNLWAGFSAFNIGLEHTGATILPIGGAADINTLLNYCKTFKVDTILSIPSLILNIAERIEKEKSKNHLHVTKIATGGEHLFEGSREFIKNVFEINKVDSLGYAANETGTIGFQCEFCNGSIFHIHEDIHYVEILNTRSNNAIGNNEVGKLIVTNLFRKLMPTIRYEVGDLGRWIDTPCKCGRKAKRFELLGRSDNILNIGGANLFPSVIAQVLDQFPILSKHFQIRAVLDGYKDKLIVTVELKPDSEHTNFSEIENAIVKSLLSNSKELKAMCENSLSSIPAINIVPYKTIQRNKRTGKIKIVIDERKI